MEDCRESIEWTISTGPYSAEQWTHEVDPQLGEGVCSPFWGDKVLGVLAPAVTHLGYLLFRIVTQREGPIFMHKLVTERGYWIEAPIVDVWRTITEPDQLTLWLCDRVDLKFVSGARGSLVMGDHDVPVVVEKVEPPKCVAFRWNFSGSEPVVGDSVLVEITLISDGGERTYIRVTENGTFPKNWSKEEVSRYASVHRWDWSDLLYRLDGVLTGHRPQ